MHERRLDMPVAAGVLELCITIRRRNERNNEIDDGYKQLGAETAC